MTKSITGKYILGEIYSDKHFFFFLISKGIQHIILKNNGSLISYSFLQYESKTSKGYYRMHVQGQFLQ